MLRSAGPAGVSTYDHSVVMSVDAIWDLEFYEDLFGASLLPRSSGRHRLKGERPTFVNFATRPIKEGRCPIIFMEMCSAVWGLFLQLDYPPKPDRMLQGPRHGFAVAGSDFARTIEGLKSLEIQFEGPFKHERESRIQESIYFKDPSGNSVELCLLADHAGHFGGSAVPEGARVPITRLLHLVLDVTDLERAEDLYGTALGIDVAYRGRTADNLEKSVIHMRNGQIVTLQKVSKVADRNAWKTLGKIHSGFTIEPEDWYEVEKRLTSRGLELLPDFVRRDNYRLDDQKSVYFADHDKNIIQLFTPKMFGA
jgi:extradiol dioxygenase family protein